MMCVTIIGGDRVRVIVIAVGCPAVTSCILFRSIPDGAGNPGLLHSRPSCALAHSGECRVSRSGEGETLMKRSRRMGRRGGDAQVEKQVTLFRRNHSPRVPGGERLDDRPASIGHFTFVELVVINETSWEMAGCLRAR